MFWNSHTLGADLMGGDWAGACGVVSLHGTGTPSAPSAPQAGLVDRPRRRTQRHPGWKLARFRGSFKSTSLTEAPMLGGRSVG